MTTPLAVACSILFHVTPPVMPVCALVKKRSRTAKLNLALLGVMYESSILKPSPAA
jgi:hypothetical protein